jgi:tRNA nucleotidyltransferase (CCA-adding enzyme)
LRLIDKLGLYHAIVTDPSQSGLPQPDIRRWHIAYDCLDELIRTRTPGSICDQLIRGHDATYFSWNLATMSPWMRIEEQLDHTRKANTPPLIAQVAREGFKSVNKLTSVIVASRRHLAEILALKKAVVERSDFIYERDRFGMAIRRWEAQGGMWRLQVLNAILVNAMDNLRTWSTEDHPGMFAISTALYATQSCH